MDKQTKKQTQDLGYRFNIAQEKRIPVSWQEVKGQQRAAGLERNQFKSKENLRGLQEGFILRYT